MKIIRKYLSTRCLVIAAILTVILGMGACRKGGINDDLDGQWQIMEVENLSTGEVRGPMQLYYCLYLHTVNLTGNGIIAGNMTYEGDRLTLEFPINTPAQLAPWFIYEKNTTFRVESLSGSRLVLLSDRVRISFRKY